MSEFPVCARCGAPITGAVIDGGVEVHRQCLRFGWTDHEVYARWIEVEVADAMSEIDTELAFLLGS